MIDQKQIAKQMIQFNKAAFDNSFKAMSMVYEQNEKMVETFLEKATWLPDEGKKAIFEWLNTYKKGCNDLKSLVDGQYGKVEEFFSTPEK
jgi:hypothetical protein